VTANAATATTKAAATATIDEYVLHRWEDQPTIVRYETAEAWSMAGPRRTNCRPIHHNTNSNNTADTYKSAVLESSAADLPHTRSRENGGDIGNNTIHIVDVNATVIRIVLFDVWNPYESFHAYLNVAMIILMFDLRNPQLVLLPPSNEHSNNSTGDMEIWRLFSDLEPIVVAQTKPQDDDERRGGGAAAPKTLYRFREVFEAPSSQLSMINTKSAEFVVTSSINKTRAGALGGRRVDHHCQSLLFRAITEWMKQRVRYGQLYEPHNNDGTAVRPSLQHSHERNSNINYNRSTAVQILWSSRRPYCCRKGSMAKPNRILVNETEWIESMASRLGEGYNVTSVDFGTLSSRESISLVANSDILVGVHGAGLVWSIFLPTTTAIWPKRQSGLVEVFGGDRDPTNRHYHNIASLANIQYRETNFWKGSNKKIRWNENRLNEVVSQIRSIVDEV
jgi:hypothetical protein